jgi:hypothetical protein
MNLQNKQQLTAVTQDARCKMQEFLSLTENNQFRVHNCMKWRDVSDNFTR